MIVRLMRPTVPLFTATLFASLLVLGCDRQDSTSGSAAKTVTVGAVLPLTGDAAAYGQSAKNGIELALEQVNASRATGAPKIMLVYEDSQSTPAKAVSALRKLITADKVPAVVGDLLSSNALAMAPVANENKVVVLSPTASAPDITKAGDYIFRNCPSDTLQGSLMAEYARGRLKLDNIGIAYVNNDYGIGIRDVFTKAFTEKAGKVVAQEAYSQGATDFRSQLTKLREANPQAIYLIGYRELGTLLKQSIELGLQTRYLSTILFEDPQILDLAGSAAEGVVYTALAYDPKDKDERVHAFVTRYKERFGSDPDIFAALSYDALQLLAKAASIERPTADHIKQALYATKGFPGVTGILSFDENGDVQVPGRLKIVRKGEFLDYQDSP